MANRKQHVVTEDIESLDLDPSLEMDLDPMFAPETLPEDHRSGFVAVIGRPNVGKSTLLNRLLGQKIAITSPKPQTTRDQIMGILTTDTAQFIFLDTPGIHKPLHKLGQAMVAIADETIRDADVVLWLVDVNDAPTEEDQLIAERLGEMHGAKPLPALVLGLNQADRWHQGEEAQARRQADYVANLGGLTPAHVVAFSATTGQGTEALMTALQGLLALGPRFYPADQVTDLQTRFIVAELIREQALGLLRNEVPHSLAVVVDEFKPRDENMTYIAANIYVERRSQKGIVLGQGGSMIKEIGKLARPQIEEMVGTKVYLELWVKVWEKWRKKEQMLVRLGYQLPKKGKK